MNYIICKDRSYFEKLGDYKYCNLTDMILPERIAIDTETTGLEVRHCDIFCVQIGTGENNYLIVMYMDNYEFKDIIPYIENKVLVGHNIKFDLGFMYKYGFFPKEVRDTLIASKIIYNGQIEYVRADFGAVMMRELKLYYDKSEQKGINEVKLSIDATIIYSFHDVDKLLTLCDVLEKKVIEGGYEETYLLHCRYIKALAYMEVCGLAINPVAWKEKMVQDIINTHTWKDTVEKYIYDNIPSARDTQLDMFDQTEKVKIYMSISSSVQMVKVFKEFGIPTKDKHGKDSINEKVIINSPHEFVKIWLNFQEANHRVSTFGEKVYNQIENDRIYTNFNPMVETARLSTRQGYINFLNFPADKITRNCFRANKGNVMVVCDWSGQETVIAADLSGDEAMTNNVLHGADLHCAFARVLFPELKGMTDEEIIKNHKQSRQDAKAPRFAFQYGGSAFTIHQSMGISMDRATEIEKGFKELHKGLFEWGARVYEESMKKGYIDSADGWKIRFSDYEHFKELRDTVHNISRMQWQMYKQGKIEYKAKKADNKYEIQNKKNVTYYNSKKDDVSRYFKLKSEYERLCLNNPVQTRGAHQLKLATSMVFEWIVANNLLWIVMIDNTIHDEIVVECREDLKDIVRDMLQKTMVEAGNHYLTNLKIKADAHYADSWGAAK